jgi:hypothetical protein
MSEGNVEQIAEDLAFVRKAVQRRRGITSLATNVLWALIILVGFSMNDFYPAGVGLFWAIAVPTGMTASGVLYWIAASRAGERDRTMDRRTMMHWLGLGVAIGLTFLLVACRAVDEQALGLPLLIILALAYYLAGVHLDSSYLWAGMVMAAGAVAAIFIRDYFATMLGVAVSAALILGGILRSRRNG